MLRTAGMRVRQCGLSERVTLAVGDAENLDTRRLFGCSAFDRVFFSYTLSMIPAWREALRCAATLRTRGAGRLHVVDFGDLEGLPAWFRYLLLEWLRLFSVEPRSELADELRLLAASSGGACSLRSLYCGYAIQGSLSGSRFRPTHT
jgi:S-adenosylmethionine-diacylgycerolhomoserine-N-methlytransferase